MNLTLPHLRLNAGFTAMAVDVQGVAGASDAPLLKKTLTNALRQGYRTIFVNLARHGEIDSRCLESFVSVARRLRRLGGRFVLLNCPDDQYSLLLTRHWDRCFLIPRRRRQDAESLPEGLRSWVSDQFGLVPIGLKGCPITLGFPQVFTSTLLAMSLGDPALSTALMLP